MTPEATDARSTHRGLRHARQRLGDRELQRAGSDGGSTITGYTVTATDSTTPANGGETATADQPHQRHRPHQRGQLHVYGTATNGVGTGGLRRLELGDACRRSDPAGAPGGATSSQGASSASPTGTATAAVSGLSASGTGEGALTVATYSGNPVVGTVSGGTGVYYDVALSSGNEFGSVTITVTDLGPGGQSIDWWTGSAWVPFSDQTFDAATDSVTATVNATTSPTEAQLIGTQIAASSNPAPSHGYWEVASDGGVFAFGGAGFYGSQGGKPLNEPIVGIAATPTGRATGRWPATAGSSTTATPTTTARSAGRTSTGPSSASRPRRAATATGWWPPTAASSPSATPGSTAPRAASRSTSRSSASPPTPTGNGYWLVASDGGVFTFGDASFYGSEGGKPLNKPIVGIAATPSGSGYWLVASDGGIFAFGDAGFFGSQGGKPLNKPIVGIAATPAATATGWPAPTAGSSTSATRLRWIDRWHRR